MRKEVKAYIKNVIKGENFHIDIISTFLGFIICIFTLVVFFNQELVSLIKYIFALALILVLLNVYKGYKFKCPERRLYLLFTVIMIGATVYSFLVFG
ncbi:MAG: hypothetical protein K5931_02025 [Lachnospiraceae bacterium]|nr:hypothetical protein [Lachnospiraceae bacterium]